MCPWRKKNTLNQNSLVNKFWKDEFNVQRERQYLARKFHGGKRFCHLMLRINTQFFSEKVFKKFDRKTLLRAVGRRGSLGAGEGTWVPSLNFKSFRFAFWGVSYVSGPVSIKPIFMSFVVISSSLTSPFQAHVAACRNLTLTGPL